MPPNREPLAADRIDPITDPPSELSMTTDSAIPPNPIESQKDSSDLIRQPIRAALKTPWPEIQTSPALSWKSYTVKCRLGDPQPPLTQLETLADEDPEGALEYADSYAHQPWAEPLIRKATLARPILSLRYSHHYKTQPWAEKIVRLAAGLGELKEDDFLHRHKTAVDFADRYCDQPWAKQILLDLCPIIAQYILTHSYGFMKQPWCGEVRDHAERCIKQNNSTLF